MSDMFVYRDRVMDYHTVTKRECAVGVANFMDVYPALSVRGVASEVVCNIGHRVRVSLLEGDRPSHVRIAEWGDVCHCSLLSVLKINL